MKRLGVIVCALQFRCGVDDNLRGRGGRQLYHLGVGRTKKILTLHRSA